MFIFIFRDNSGNESFFAVNAKDSREAIVILMRNHPSAKRAWEKGDEVKEIVVEESVFLLSRSIELRSKRGG